MINFRMRAPSTLLPAFLDLLPLLSTSFLLLPPLPLNRLLLRNLTNQLGYLNGLILQSLRIQNGITDVWKIDGLFLRSKSCIPGTNKYKVKCTECANSHHPLIMTLNGTHNVGEHAKKHANLSKVAEWLRHQTKSKDEKEATKAAENSALIAVYDVVVVFVASSLCLSFLLLFSLLLYLASAVWILGWISSSCKQRGRSTLFSESFHSNLENLYKAASTPHSSLCRMDSLRQASCVCC